MKQTWSDLVERAKQNDQSAFYDLYQNSYDVVYRTVKSMVRDEDAALDITQDAFVRGFSNLSTLENPEQFLAWMKRIATNTAKNWFKKKHEMTFSQMADEDGNEPDFEDERTENLPEAVIDRNETARLIKEILDSLPDEQRLVIGMFYYQNMTVAEIAEELEISENTVKSRLNYGKKKIRASVEDLEKKGTKLYALAPIPFLLLLFKNQTLQATAGNAPVAAFGSIMSAASGAAAAGNAASGGAASTGAAPGSAAAGGSASGGATAASSAAATAAGKTAGGGLLASLGAKITAGVLAAALIGGGVGTGVYLANRDSGESKSSIVSEAISSKEGSSVLETESSLSDAPVMNEESIVSDETVVSDESIVSDEPVISDDPVISDEPVTSGDPEVEGSVGLEFWLDSYGYYNVIGIGSCTDTNIVIPASYDGLPVRRIREGAFYQCTGLTSITIPDGVTSIGENAFFGCENLTSVAIPNSVEYIGMSAFERCSSLTSVIIPDNVKYIDVGTFAYCTSLKSITLPNGFTGSGYYSFKDCKNLADITYNGTKASWENCGMWIDDFHGYITVHCIDGDIRVSW